MKISLLDAKEADVFNLLNSSKLLKKVTIKYHYRWCNGTFKCAYFCRCFSACPQTDVFGLAGWAMPVTTLCATLETPFPWPRHSVSSLDLSTYYKNSSVPDVKNGLNSQCLLV